MKSLKLNFFGLLLLCSFSVLFVQCEDEPAEPTLSGEARFEITDAPIDNANVQGAFVTVTAVKVDGRAISNLEVKQTVDLLALQNGNTEILGSTELEAGTYGSLELVLDYETDASGNAPGCYVLLDGGEKEALAASADNTLELTGNFTVNAEQTTNVVMDFDVRKAIRSTEDEGYQFTSDNELNSSVRVVTKSETGTVNGEVENSSQFGSRVVVYAYERGTYDRDTELSGQGSGEIEFRNAVTSAIVRADGNYTIAFLEEGDYELHFIAYEAPDSDGDREAAGELELSLLGSLGLDLNNVSVAANASLSVNVTAIGILP